MSRFFKFALASVVLLAVMAMSSPAEAHGRYGRRIVRHRPHVHVGLHVGRFHLHGYSAHRHALYHRQFHAYPTFRSYYYSPGIYGVPAYYGGYRHGGYCW